MPHVLVKDQKVLRNVLCIDINWVSYYLYCIKYFQDKRLTCDVLKLWRQVVPTFIEFCVVVNSVIKALQCTFYCPLDLSREYLFPPSQLLQVSICPFTWRGKAYLVSQGNLYKH